MKELTADQLKVIRRSKGKKTPKQLAKELKVPKKLVEAALEQPAAAVAAASGGASPAGRGEPKGLLALAAVLVLVLGYLGYAGTLSHTQFHFDDDHTIKTNRAIRSYYKRVHGENARTDLSGLEQLKRKLWAVGEASEDIFAFNANRTVTFWSFTLSYDSYPFDKATTLEERDAYFAGWHRTNLRIHLLNGLLALWLAYLTFTAPVFRASGRASRAPVAAAALVAVIFVAHPLQTQAVTYLAQRTESLCVTFYLLALGCYAAARTRSLGPKAGSAPWKSTLVLGGAVALVGFSALLAATGVAGFGLLKWTFVLACVGATGALVWLCKRGEDEWGHAALSGGAFLAFMIGLLSKEIAATIPLAICAWDLCFVRGAGEPRPAKLWAWGSLRRGLATRLRDLGPWALVTAAAAVAAAPVAGRNILRQFGSAAAVGGENEQALVGPLQYLLTQANVLWTYVRVAVLPYGQNLDYDYPIVALSPTDGATWLALFSGAILAACVALAVWRGGQARVPAFALGLILVVLAPTSSLIVLPDVIYEHRFYLPLLGVALVFAALAARLARHTLGPEKEAWVLWGLALVLGAGLTGLTVSRNAVWETEVSLWRDVTEKSPDRPRGWTNLGLALLNTEPQRIALTDGQVFEGRALRLPDESVLLKAMRTEFMNEPPGRVPSSKVSSITDVEGGPEQASVAFRKAIELDPDYTKAHNNLSLSQISLAKLRQAEYDAIVELGKSMRAQAERLVKGPKTPETAAQVERSLKIAADMSAVAEELEAAIGAHLREAEQSLKRSIEVKEALGKEDPILMANLGGLYASELNDLEQAFHWLERSYKVVNGIPVSQVTAADIRMTQSQELYEAGAKKGVPHEDLVEQCRPYWEQARDLYKGYLSGKATDPQFVKLAQERLARVSRFLAGQFEEEPQPPGPGVPPR
ncbi:MAG: hypothetical protein KDD82_03185 [Planctomycetes bacterium]|nr:hypothetical protein [Planctomycetota bacterium]